MTAKNKKAKKAAKGSSKNVVTRGLRMAGSMGGTPLREYAKLLTNPCTGPLVHAPGSTSGGMVMRFESDFIIGNGASDTAGFFSWAPGALNSNSPTNPYGAGTLTGAGVSDATFISPSAGGIGTYFPGHTYLTSNASSYRAIAACVQVYWPGTELNRSGIVSAAQGTFGLFSTATTIQPSALRAVSPVVERMPTDHMEVRWAPNYADGLFRNPSSTTSSPEDGHAALVITWAGIPVSTGVRIRCVLVVEWLPKPQGITLSSNTSTGSAGDIQHVRRELDRRNAGWWYQTGQAAANFLSGLTVAYAERRGPATPLLRGRDEL